MTIAKKLLMAAFVLVGFALWAPIASEAVLVGAGALQAQAVDDPEQPFLQMCVDICVWRNTDPEYCCQ